MGSSTDSVVLDSLGLGGLGGERSSGSLQIRTRVQGKVVTEELHDEVQKQDSSEERVELGNGVVRRYLGGVACAVGEFRIS